LFLTTSWVGNFGSELAAREARVGGKLLRLPLFEVGNGETTGRLDPRAHVLKITTGELAIVADRLDTVRGLHMQKVVPRPIP